MVTEIGVKFLIDWDMRYITLLNIGHCFCYLGNNLIGNNGVKYLSKINLPNL